jgi:hypothetical protein
MSFDEQPDGDQHGECAEEIKRLERELAAMTAEKQRLQNLLKKSERTELREENSALNAECAELRKDATRYRWIRAAGAWESEIGMDGLSENPSLFDAAVDAAMGEKP